MMRYISSILVPFRAQLIRDLRLPEDQYCLIILDNHSSHLTPKVLEEFETQHWKYSFLPPNTTSKLQPLDVGFNGPIKKMLQTNYDEFMRAKIEEHLEKEGNLDGYKHEGVRELREHVVHNLSSAVTIMSNERPTSGLRTWESIGLLQIFDPEFQNQALELLKRHEYLAQMAFNVEQDDNNSSDIDLLNTTEVPIGEAEEINEEEEEEMKTDGIEQPELAEEEAKMDGSEMEEEMEFESAIQDEEEEEEKTPDEPENEDFINDVLAEMTARESLGLRKRPRIHY